MGIDALIDLRIGHRYPLKPARAFLTNKKLTKVMELMIRCSR